MALKPRATPDRGDSVKKQWKFFNNRAPNPEFPCGYQLVKKGETQKVTKRGTHEAQT